VPPAALVSGLGLTRARWDGESNANGRRGQAQAGGGGAAERRRSIYFQQAAEAAEQAVRWCSGEAGVETGGDAVVKRRGGGVVKRGSAGGGVEGEEPCGEAPTAES
jgi:hypothetical protein